MREACRRLANEGLVQIVPFRGYTITPLTIEEYRKLTNKTESILDRLTVTSSCSSRATDLDADKVMSAESRGELLRNLPPFSE